MKDLQRDVVCGSKLGIKEAKEGEGRKGKSAHQKQAVMIQKQKRGTSIFPSLEILNKIY